VNVPYHLIGRFRAAVLRIGPHEHRWIKFSHASVIGDGARPISTVRVLVDALGREEQTDDADEAATDVALRALIFLKLEDLRTSTSVEVFSA
jgi:hypothetical protein